MSGWLPADENDHARMDDLIAATLQHNLEILPEDELTNALHIFIDKDEKVRGGHGTCSCDTGAE